MTRGLAFAAAFAIVAACGPGARGTKKAPVDHATVVIDCNVESAEVWVDGRYVAPIAKLGRGLSLPPGAHRLEIRDDDHFAHYAELEVGPRERRRLEVELAEILP